MTNSVEETDPHLNIPASEKIKRLSRMSEQDFRDVVVRPLFLTLGYHDGRELHGADEEGKDLLFVEEDRLREKRIVCVQTKKGKITMAAKQSENIQNIVTQLRVALNTRVSRIESKQQYYPDEVILCASGIINVKAQRHIASELQRDRQIKFLDGQSIVNLIDTECPHLWQGISVDIFAHYDTIRKHVEYNTSDIIDPGAANDSTFVQLTLYRQKRTPVRRHGQVTSHLEFEELRTHDLINRAPDTLLIVADAGSGKSTALWRVAYDIVRHNQGTGHRIPLLVFARDLAEEMSSCEQLIDELYRLSSEFSATKEKLFRQEDMHEGRITLLVDGIDEISDPTVRHSIVNMLCEFRRLYPRCTLIATTRPDSTTTEHFKNRGVTIYNIAPISWRQVKSIIEQVLSNRRFSKTQLDSVTAGAHNVLRQIEEVHGFQITPLLATVYAASADYSRSDIPANITELFKKYTELMLGRWDEQKGLSQQYRAPLKDFILRQIGYEMHRSRQLHVSREWFGKAVRDRLAERGHRMETREIEDELLNRSRLLRRRREGIGFAHVLLQEFFAGRSMPSDAVVTYLDDPWWTKPIVFFYGDNPERADHLSRVQKAVMKRSEQNPLSYRAIGLALQASYLSVLTDKLEIWSNVILKLSEVMATFLDDSEQENRFRITDMTFAYLRLRDAVAFSSLSDPNIRVGILDGLRPQAIHYR